MKNLLEKAGDNGFRGEPTKPCKCGRFVAAGLQPPCQAP
ncbi:Uncharacterized protein dnm_057570 [Desulfonema magnum]|uniref:Uncharacterized protein n=1 Tax=Desulfonema magnum TaxID=45655 RepID=A0A975GQA5_9BACT|nr:Uncharacterized protein dnm_057570 [Desulfonema magnum]